jgi:hypothetical protein
MNQGIIVKVHLQVSLSQVIDKFHRSVRNGIVLHDIPDILLDISTRSDLDHPACIQGHSPSHVEVNPYQFLNRKGIE